MCRLINKEKIVIKKYLIAYKEIITQYRKLIVTYIKYLRENRIEVEHPEIW
jgi:hypothetical protein